MASINRLLVGDGPFVASDLGRNYSVGDDLIKQLWKHREEEAYQSREEEGELSNCV